MPEQKDAASLDSCDSADHRVETVFRLEPPGTYRSAFVSAAVLSVRSQVRSGSFFPKWP